jgi:hypothetical protein
MVILMNNTEKTDALNSLILEAHSTIVAAGSSLPGLQEAVDRVVQKKTSSSKIVMLVELIDWMDDIDPVLARSLQRRLGELRSKN